MATHFSALAAYRAADYYKAAQKATPLILIEKDSPFAPIYTDTSKASTSWFPLECKKASVSAETARNEAPPTAVTRDKHASSRWKTEHWEKYWDYADENFPRLRSLHNKSKTAAKALRAFEKSTDKDVDEEAEKNLRRRLDKADFKYEKYMDMVEAAYKKSLRGDSSDSDFVPGRRDFESDEEAEDDESFDAEAAEEPEDREEPATDDEAAAKKKKVSKRKFSSPATSDVKKKPRAPRGSKPKKPLSNGCSCSCGVCTATETSEICYDKTLKTECCKKCYAKQTAAFSYFWSKKKRYNPAHKWTTTKTCWTNQCMEVKDLGLGGGRYIKTGPVVAAGED
jgi:hypothetical protein